MTPVSLKPLTLALAVAVALSACKPASEPVAGQAPSPPAPVLAIDESKLPPLPAFQAADLDPGVAACADFDAHVNGRWKAANPVPADKTRWGSFDMLRERSLAVQQQLVEAAAATPGASGIEKLVGDFYASGMDQAGIDAAGIEPLRPMLAEIDAVSDGAAVAELIRRQAARGLSAGFGYFIDSDYKDADKVIYFAFQGGLGLPEKSYYFEDKDGKKEKREAYVGHVARTLELAGVAADEAARQAAAVLAFETRLAKASLARVDLRDPANQYKYMTVAEADAVSPNFPWSRYFQALGVTVEGFSLSQPAFFAEFDRMLADEPVANWQAYLRFHTIDGFAPFLAAPFEQQNFDFNNKVLLGQQEMRPRWQRVLATVNNGVGEALGQIYVAQAFPPESKASMERLVGNLSAALKARLENLDWMGDETKAKALEKWASFTPKVGYPDKWRSWDGLSVSRASYLDNVLAATEFNFRFELGKLGKPKDRGEWGMSPQTVNAYYNPSLNEIVFPAAILQPPFFDAKADDALNYGGIGAVIGHEMLHGYDDQGSQFDANGAYLEPPGWWTQADYDRFQARTGKLVQQFDGYEALPGIHVKGELTLGENIADLGGLTVAYDALKRAQGEGQADPQVEGLGQDQRFFMNWATVWRGNIRDETLKVFVDTDSHSPARFRALGAPSNMDAFAAAFSCKQGDPMVRPAADKVVIW